MEARFIRVMVVDDQRLIREGIASLLSLQEGIEVVGTAENGLEAVEKAATLTPDVILMDVRMPVMDGLEATAQITRQHTTGQILMLTTFDDEDYIVKALQLGAKGYLLKDIPPSDLAQAIRLTHAGIYQLDASVAGKLIGTLTRFHQSPPVIHEAARQHDALTERNVGVQSELDIRLS